VVTLGGSMNKQLKQALATGLMVMGFGIVAHAGGGQTDVMQVSVTPSVTYSVTITSVNASGYQFGIVALGQTTASTSAITIKNSGNVAEFFAMSISNSTGSWTSSTVV